MGDLEASLARERQILEEFKEMLDRELKCRVATEEKILNNKRITKFLKDHKLADVDLTKLDEIDIKPLLRLRKKVMDLKEHLREFDGLEPTNEGLRNRIEELKKSRLSLDMTFD